MSLGIITVFALLNKWYIKASFLTYLTMLPDAKKKSAIIRLTQLQKEIH